MNGANHAHAENPGSNRAHPATNAQIPSSSAHLDTPGGSAHDPPVAHPDPAVDPARHQDKERRYHDHLNTCERIVLQKSNLAMEIVPSFDTIRKNMKVTTTPVSRQSVLVRGGLMIL